MGDLYDKESAERALFEEGIPAHLTHVRIAVTIRDELSGQDHVEADSYEGDESAQHRLAFDWTENDYSCDCNRGLFFGHHGIDAENVCGDGRYRITAVRML